MGAAAVPIMVVRSVLSDYGKYQQGQAAKSEGAFQQRMANMQAGQVEASAQQSAFDEERKARLLQSRALAYAAASGAGASDPTAVKIMSDISAEGSHRAGIELYNGEEKARYLRMTGQAEADQGNAAARAYETSAVGGLLSDAGSFYAKYNKKDTG